MTSIQPGTQYNLFDFEISNEHLPNIPAFVLSCAYGGSECPGRDPTATIKLIAEAGAQSQTMLDWLRVHASNWRMYALYPTGVPETTV